MKYQIEFYPTLNTQTGYIDLCEREDEITDELIQEKLKAEEKKAGHRFPLDDHSGFASFCIYEDGLEMCGG